MLVYLLLWFSLLFNHICNGLEDLAEGEGKSTSRKYRNPDRSFKQHIVAHNPRQLPDTLVDKESPAVNMKDLLSKLRDSWEAPSSYLEKRGYLTNKRFSQEHKGHHKMYDSREHEGDVKSFKEQLRKYHERKNALFKSPVDKDDHLSRDTLEKDPKSRLTNQRNFFYFPHIRNKAKKESRNETSTVSTSTTSTTTEMNVVTCSQKSEKPGLMSRLRNSFRSFFEPSKAKSFQDDFSMYNDAMNEESADNTDMKNAKQKYFNFRRGGSYINQEDSNHYLLQKRSYNDEIQPLIGEKTAESQSSFCGRNPTSALTNSSTVLSPDLSVKFSDVLKNITQADIDYVKNFLKCYKENKEKFYVDYLHMNKTLFNETSSLLPSTHGVHNNFTETEKNTNEGIIKCQPDVMTSTTTTTIAKITNTMAKTGPKDSQITTPAALPTKSLDSGRKESQTTTPVAAKDDDTIKVKIDIKNETGSETTSATNEIQQPNESTTEATTETITETTPEEPKASTPSTKTNPCSTKCQSATCKPSKTALTPTSTSFTPSPPQPAKLDASSNGTEKFHLNDTTSNGEVQSYDLYANKLKFLAHQHHPVDQVGKRPHKRLDLMHIQELIDGARETLAVGSLGIEEENHNHTKCTPIRLNEISLDLEWSSKDDNDSQNQPFGGSLTSSISGDNEQNEKDDCLSEYSKDSQYFQANQFPISYSNNLNMPSSLSKYGLPKLGYNSEFLVLDPNKKKREIALPEGTADRAVQEEATMSDYSELLPSLSEFGSSRKHPLSLDEYIEDYSLGLSRNAKSAGSEGNEDYDYDDDSTDDTQLFGRKKKKKRKHKKKYNKKNSNKINLSANPSHEDPSEFIVEEEDTSVPEGDQIEDQQSNNDFLNFPEFSDIKFHVNSDQEEAIERFIAGLNAPPEVFSFDVNKYLKPKSVSEPLSFDSPPAKTFYEFVGAPQIENERIPFITPESGESPSLPDAAVETLAKENHSLHPKRDILRQYIKGVSEHIANRPSYQSAPISPTDKQSQDIEAQRNIIPIDRSEALITNYANDLDVLNYEQYQSAPKEASADDFIDKFYLLNDGSYSVYGSDKPKEKQEEKGRVDLVNLDIDLDLDRKFKDLNVLRAPMAKAPVEKELDLNKEPVNNLDLVYIPENVYHKSPPAEKTNEEKPLSQDGK